MLRTAYPGRVAEPARARIVWHTGRPDHVDRGRPAMVESWNDDTPGLVTLPSGVRVRGRGLRAGLPAGMQPTLGVYLAGRPPPPTSWEQRWIRWPDFWIPTDAAAATRTLREALEAASEGRVEIACGGGVGRTGTALAALCVLEGAARTRP